MNVTNDRFKDRQLHNEDYLQMVSAEQKEYAEVSACQRTAKNNRIICGRSADKIIICLLLDFCRSPLQITCVLWKNKLYFKMLNENTIRCK